MNLAYVPNAAADSYHTNQANTQQLKCGYHNI